MFGNDIKLKLPKKLRKALERDAGDAGLALETHVLKKLENTTSPVVNLNKDKIERNLETLIAYLKKVPLISVLSHGVETDTFWWVKFNIDTKHPLAWRVVQELGHVLNYLSLNEKLPTVFMPVSPPPYMNGGEEFLSWVIEAKQAYVDPKWIAEFLEGRLPRPVNNLKEWEFDDEF